MQSIHQLEYASKLTLRAAVTYVLFSTGSEGNRMPESALPIVVFAGELGALINSPVSTHSAIRLLALPKSARFCRTVGAFVRWIVGRSEFERFGCDDDHDAFFAVPIKLDDVASRSIVAPGKKRSTRRRAR